jgi:hypothetical protein
LSPTALCRCGERAPLPTDNSPDEPVRCRACGALLPRDAITTGPGPAPDDRYAPDRPEEPDTPLTGRRFPDVTLPAGVMCSPRAVGIATFLCGPMAGILLLVSNDLSTGRRLRGWLALLLGTLVCLAMGLVLVRLPDESARTPCVLPLGNLVVLWLLAHALQGRAYRDHIRRGGPAPGAAGSSCSAWWGCCCSWGWPGRAPLPGRK